MGAIDQRWYSRFVRTVLFGAAGVLVPAVAPTSGLAAPDPIHGADEAPVQPIAEQGGTIAVVVEASEGGPLPATTFRSVMWHALYQDQGHDAVFLDQLDASAVQAMRGTPMTTLLHVELSWQADSVRVERAPDDVFMVGGHYPVVHTTEYALDGDRLVARTTWTTEGPVSVYHVKGDDPYRFISLPEVSLQETASLAISPVQAPVWMESVDRVRVPVVIAADDEYRAYYGEAGWDRVARRAVARANALLVDAGIELEVVGEETWDTPSDLDDLSSILESLYESPRTHPEALRVGFTGQTELAVTWQSEMEDVGRAYLPGRDLVIADQAANPGHDPAWDTAEEGVAVAHEALHTLGIPHLEQPDRLMSATKRGTVHALSLSTQELARSAATSRYAHWDTMTALASLSQSAEDHLDDPALQLDFITENLAFGPGVPEPGTLEPRQLSALTNVAVGRYYLRLAQEDPVNAWKLQRGARVHVDSALAQEPTWQEARQLQRLVVAAQRATRPQVDRPDVQRSARPTLDDLAAPLYGDRDTCHVPDADPTCE